MSNFLKDLVQLGEPNLVEYDRDALTEQIIDKIKSDPQWNGLWDGELLQNFLYSIISTFSFIFSKNAETINRLARENFVTSAKDPNSITNHLVKFGINYKQNTASVVQVVVSNVTGAGFTRQFQIPPGFKIPAVDLSGNPINFEIYNRDPFDSSKIDYRSPISIGTTSKETVEAFSGDTFRFDFALDPLTQNEKFIYKLDVPDIIEGSIRIYYSFNQANERELINTDTFVVTPVDVDVNDFPGGTPHFKIKYNENGSAEIIFGTESFGGSFPKTFPSNITLFCRSGGGSLSNITSRSINTNNNVQISNSNTIPVLFRNFLPAQGGTDRELVEEAQFYAPYRIGRGGVLIDDIDIINELANLTVKHVVKSPKYADISTGQKIPILHYWNYIAPKRDFNSFILPQVTSLDTITTYSEKLNRALNEFLNLQGIHDGIEENIFMNFYTDEDFVFQLDKKPALNGTIFISAFDESNREIDRLSFKSNYIDSPVPVSDFEDFAEIKTLNPITAPVIITAGVNDVLRFKIDESIPFGFAPQAQFLTITIPAALYGLTGGKSEALANQIDQLIKASDVYYFGFQDRFCFIDDDRRLTIRSQRTGASSSVRIFNGGNSINATIGLPSRYEIPKPGNGRIFSNTSFFDSNTQELNVRLNLNREEKEITFTPTGGIVWPNPDFFVGPSFTYQMRNENNETFLVKEGSSIKLECFTVHGTSTVKTGEILFDNISTVSPNPGISQGVTPWNPLNVGGPFEDSQCVFAYETNTLSIKMRNDNAAGPVFTFPKFLDSPGTPNMYDSSSFFVATVFEKGYKFSTVTYEPNPYFHEAEAKSITDILKGRGKKSLALEPMLKKVKFVPINISCSVVPNNGVSNSEAIKVTEDLIYENFEYSNRDRSRSIGTGLSKSRIESFLSDRNRNRAVRSLSVITPAQNISDPDEDSYYFILPRELIERLEAFEESEPNIEGLAGLYRPSVIVQ